MNASIKSDRKTTPEALIRPIVGSNEIISNSNGTGKKCSQLPARLFPTNKSVNFTQLAAAYSLLYFLLGVYSIQYST